MVDEALASRERKGGDEDMMIVDWGQAVQIGGVGFGMVFAILVILAIVIWLVGLVVNKISPSQGETRDKKRGS
ncbi:hypothetical protein ES703_81265 [subsurface metagenome]